MIRVLVRRAKPRLSGIVRGMVRTIATMSTFSSSTQTSFRWSMTHIPILVFPSFSPFFCCLFFSLLFYSSLPTRKKREKKERKQTSQRLLSVNSPSERERTPSDPSGACKPQAFLLRLRTDHDRIFPPSLESELERPSRSLVLDTDTLGRHLLAPSSWLCGPAKGVHWQGRLASCHFAEHGESGI
jgi:hypothetical protein